MNIETIYKSLFIIAVVYSLSGCGIKEMKLNGGTYKGEVVDGKPEGIGVFHKGSISYNGEWHEGFPDGFGKYYCAKKVKGHIQG